jgi:hypothetical protein
MATRLLITCPECRLPIQLEYAVTTRVEPDGSTTAVVDGRAIAMHTCMRVDE